MGGSLFCKEITIKNREPTPVTYSLLSGMKSSKKYSYKICILK